MFSNLRRELDTYHAEIITSDYLFRGLFRPLGELAIFLNDRARDYVSLQEADVMPLAVDRQVRGMHREMLSINKPHFFLLALLDDEERKNVHILASKRPVIFYFGPIIVRGHLHVNVDASDEDLLDVSRDFYPVSDASIYPVRTLGTNPTRQVPLLFVNRPLVQGYHPHTDT